MAKSIIIIGAGMGGMAAGIYGQINGYETQILASFILANLRWNASPISMALRIIEKVLKPAPTLASRFP